MQSHMRQEIVQYYDIAAAYEIYLDALSPC